jgi:hypothetical protein
MHKMRIARSVPRSSSVYVYSDVAYSEAIIELAEIMTAPRARAHATMHCECSCTASAQMLPSS